MFGVPEGLIRQYFFKNAEGNASVVNGEGYRAIITHFFISRLKHIAFDDMWLQREVIPLAKRLLFVTCRGLVIRIGSHVLFLESFGLLILELSEGRN